MFQKIRYQLTVAYVGVLTVILVAFAFAVRFTFTRSLDQQLSDRLKNLAKAAAFNMDLEYGKLDIDDDEILVSQRQGIQWFDLQGKSVAKQGKYHLTIPLNLQQALQNQQYPYPVRGFTSPVINLENGKLIGYVRASESLTELNNTLSRLDWGLGSGVVLALTLSGFGGIWLTRQAMGPIEESFLRLKQFTADASHELRSPLMAVQSNAAVALKYPQGMRPTDREKFEMIASASQQMTRLTQDLLMLARADRVTKPAWGKVNLTIILSELVELYKVQAWEKELDWQAQLTEDLYLLADGELLKQLFTNLMQNAIYYTPRGGSVKIQANQVGSNLIVKVQDTGIGIASEDLPKVFERFWRAEKSRSYKTGKSGLGLAIAQTIAQQHKGLITVESQLGVGSCFTVRFRAIKSI